MPVPPTGILDLYLFDVAGISAWQTAERLLVDRHSAERWSPGVYRIDVTQDAVPPSISEVRRLPLDPAYAALPYRPSKGVDLPIRDDVRMLARRYPGATPEQIARHWEPFSDHYHARIGTATLTEATGWEPPPDWARPLAPQVGDHRDAARLPQELR